MKKYIHIGLLFVTALILLSGCSASYEEVQKEAQIAVEEAFNESPKETNQKSEDIEVYLPFGFEIVDQTPNNVILKNGSKTYILFYNQNENSSSKVVYKSTLQQKEKFDIKETFEKDQKFGFLLIKKLDEQENELTVGIGGNKISTEVKTRNLASEAAVMMEIVNSVTIN